MQAVNTYVTSARYADKAEAITGSPTVIPDRSALENGKLSYVKGGNPRTLDPRC